MKFAFISDQRNYPFYHVKWICINITIMTKVESGNLDVCLECADKWIYATLRHAFTTPCKSYIITQFTTVFLKASSPPTHHMMHYLTKFGCKKSMKAKKNSSIILHFWPKKIQ